MSDLFEKLSRSKKYRGVCPDTLRRVIADCVPKYKKEKDAESAIREHLHGITAAFMTEAEVKKARNAAEEGDFAALLGCHASTRERLPIEATDALYAHIFNTIGVPETLLDLACGLNPAYLKWKYPQIRVVGTDISGQCVALLRTLDIDARCADLLCGVLEERYDAALLFKVLPLLDRQRAGSAVEILEAVNAKSVIVSFPTRSLSGRSVGMEANYGAWMAAHLPEKYAVKDSFATENELYFIFEEK